MATLVPTRMNGVGPDRSSHLRRGLEINNSPAEREEINMNTTALTPTEDLAVAL